MNSKVFLLAVLFILAFTIAQNNAYGETWKIQIPSGASEINTLAHYLPSEMSIRVGDKVEWGNADRVDHTVTSGTMQLGLTGIFDSGFIGPGSKFSVTFDENDIGEIKYFCKLHPWMIGIINVVELDAGFQVFHNVGSKVSKSPIDIAYKVERNLVNVSVDTVRKSLTFDFAGKINNDEFIVRLPEDLIKDPQSVWINDKQTTNYELSKTDEFNTLVMTLGDHVQQVKIVGVEVIGKADPKEHILINQINGILDKKFYERGDNVTVSGIVQNPVQLYKVSLEIISPEGYTAYQKDIQLADSKFTETIPSKTLREFGKYEVKITAPDAKNLGLSFELGIAAKEIQSPLKQMKSGTDSRDVICNEGFELFMKVSNGKAICVHQSTGENLVKRGWADYF